MDVFAAPWKLTQQQSSAIQPFARTGSAFLTFETIRVELLFLVLLAFKLGAELNELIFYFRLRSTNLRKTRHHQQCERRTYKDEVVCASNR